MSLWGGTVFLIGLAASWVSPIYCQQPSTKGPIITLERSRCFGWCPAYSLSIYSDGAVKFTPLGGAVYRESGAEPTLPLKGTISSDQVKSLVREFERVRFYSLKERYDNRGDSGRSKTCPEYWTDMPWAETSIVYVGKSKRVHHYLGCRGSKILSDLEALENKIDEVVEVKKWTSKYGWGAGSVTDVQLKVIPTPSPKPQ